MLGEESTYGIYVSLGSVEKKLNNNFNKKTHISAWVLPCNADNSYLFVNGIFQLSLRQKSIFNEFSATESRWVRFLS